MIARTFSQYSCAWMRVVVFPTWIPFCRSLYIERRTYKVGDAADSEIGRWNVHS